MYTHPCGPLAQREACGCPPFEFSCPNAAILHTRSVSTDTRRADPDTFRSLDAAINPFIFSMLWLAHGLHFFPAQAIGFGGMR